MTRSAGLVLAVALGAVLAAATAAAEQIDREYLETFAVHPGDRLLLQHGDGDVTVTSWDQDSLRVEVRYHATVNKFGLGKDPDFRVEFAQEGPTVRVSGVEEGGAWLGFLERREQEHVYLIRAPSWLDLETAGDDGDVRIEGWRGSIDCRLDDGDLELRDVEAPRVDLTGEDGDLRLSGLRTELTVRLDDGDLTLDDSRLPRCRLQAEDGDLTVDGCEGELELRTEDGDVSVRATRAGKLRVRSEGGDVDLELRGPDRLDVDVETEDGDVRLDLPPDASATISAESLEDGVRTDLPPAVLREQAEDRIAGTVGAGEGRVEIRTETGRITVMQRR